MKKILMALALLIVASPAWSQLDNAKKIWSRNIASTAPNNLQCLVWVSARNRWEPGSCAAAGSGTVTSVGFTGGLVSVANPTTTPAFTVAGTSGGLVYFSSATTWASSGAMASGQFVLGGGAGAAPTTSFSIVTVAKGGTGLASGTSGGVLAYTASGTLASSGALTVGLPVIGGGAGAVPTVGTRSGNTTQYVTTTGTLTSGDCVKIDASGNFIANGSACGGGGGSSAFNDITSGTNTTAAMVVGAGASMDFTAGNLIVPPSFAGTCLGLTTISSSSVLSMNATCAGYAATAGSNTFGVTNNFTQSSTLASINISGCTANPPSAMASGGVFCITTGAFGFYNNANTEMFATYEGSGFSAPTAPTAGRCAFWGAVFTLSQDSDCSFATDTLTVTKIIGSTSITDSGLTATRMVFAGTGGLLSDDSDCTFATDTLTCTKVTVGTTLTMPNATVTPAKMAASTFDTQTDGATVTWAIGSVLNANAVLTFTVHSGSRTLNITNPVIGGNYVLKVIQDSTGGEGLILGTGCTWKVINGGSGAVTPSTGASALDILAFTYDGTNCLATFGKNYN